jgi:hypothetical protein
MKMAYHVQHIESDLETFPIKTGSFVGSIWVYQQLEGALNARYVDLKSMRVRGGYDSPSYPSVW